MEHTWICVWKAAHWWTYCTLISCNIHCALTFSVVCLQRLVLNMFHCGWFVLCVWNANATKCLYLAVVLIIVFRIFIAECCPDITDTASIQEVLQVETAGMETHQLTSANSAVIAKLWCNSHQCYLSADPHSWTADSLLSHVFPCSQRIMMFM